MKPMNKETIKRDVTVNEQERTVTVESHVKETFKADDVKQVYDDLVSQRAQAEQLLQEVNTQDAEADDPTWAAKDVEFAKLQERYNKKAQKERREKQKDTAQELIKSATPFIDELRDPVAKLFPDKAVN